MTPRWSAIPHPHVKDGWTLTRHGVIEGLYVSKASAEMAASHRNTNRNGGMK